MRNSPRSLALRKASTSRREDLEVKLLRQKRQLQRKEAVA